jgi:hypothetical protein
MKKQLLRKLKKGHFFLDSQAYQGGDPEHERSTSDEIQKISVGRFVMVIIEGDDDYGPDGLWLKVTARKADEFIGRVVGGTFYGENYGIQVGHSLAFRACNIIDDRERLLSPHQRRINDLPLSTEHNPEAVEILRLWASGDGTSQVVRNLNFHLPARHWAGALGEAIDCVSFDLNDKDYEEFRRSIYARFVGINSHRDRREQFGTKDIPGSVA